MAEKDLNIEITEKTVDEETEKVTAEQAEQELSAEATEADLKPKRKACCKKTTCCKKGTGKACRAICLGAACLTVLAAAGCVLWLWNKYGEKLEVKERLNEGMNRFICR